MRRFNRPYPEYRVNAYAPTDTVPMSEMNTTPLIDVLLVLLIMIIMSIPIAQHELKVDLPGETPPRPTTPAPQISLSLTANGAALWDGEAVTTQQLQARLAETAAQRPDAVIRFQPNPMTSYNDAVQVINLVDDAGIEKFAFIGNHQYAEFGRGD